MRARDWNQLRLSQGLTLRMRDPLVRFYRKGGYHNAHGQGYRACFIRHFDLMITEKGHRDQRFVECLVRLRRIDEDYESSIIIKEERAASKYGWKRREGEE
jgi:hypothetical protein